MSYFNPVKHTVQELIEHLQTLPVDDFVIADIWRTEDIRSAGEHLEKLTDEQCKTVMAYMHKEYSTEQGYNNSIINDSVDECIDQGLIEYEYPTL